MLTEKAILKTETVFSEDRRHRYLLRKEWDTKKPKATIIMTNPSSADLMTMDYTTLYIMNNVVRLDFGSIDIVNMVSKITTRLDVKNDIDAKMDKENTDFIIKSAEKADKVIIAWGKLGENNKKVRELQESILESLKPFRDKLYIIFFFFLIPWNNISCLSLWDNYILVVYSESNSPWTYQIL